MLFRSIEHLVLRGPKPTGGEAVDCDAVPAPVVCEAHRELLNAAATSPIRSQTSVAKDAGDGPDVDDSAIAMLAVTSPAWSRRGFWMNAQTSVFNAPSGLRRVDLQPPGSLMKNKS